MGKIDSRQKGARFERQLAGMFRDYGYQARRTAQYCGNTGDASDVVGLPGIHVEAKHVEQMRLYEWMEQAERDSKGTGQLPAVFHKNNHAEVLVTMRLDDWIQLYREWEAGENDGKIKGTEDNAGDCTGCAEDSAPGEKQR